MINIKINEYLNFTSGSKNYQIESEQLIGDFILKLKEDEVIQHDENSLNLKDTSKFIGYDYLLNKRFNEYSELKTSLSRDLIKSPP